jgi:phosphoribosylformylglycinamidine synthase
VALTDGLNFGNPQRPEVFWQFERAVRGIADASEAFRVPVVSGNVSFYNETKYADGSTLEILPTPMMGAVGVLERAEQRIGMGVGAGNFRLALVRPTGTEYVQQGLGASLYATTCGVEDGVPCAPDLDAEIALQEWLPSLVERGLLAATHDVTDGGLSVTLAEMAMASGRGLMVVLSSAATEGLSRADAVAFGELPGWVVMAYAPEHEHEVLASCPGALAIYPVGEMTTGQDVVLHMDELGTTLTQPLDKLRAAYKGAGIL